MARSTEFAMLPEECVQVVSSWLQMYGLLAYHFDYDSKRWLVGKYDRLSEFAAMHQTVGILLGPPTNMILNGFQSVGDLVDLGFIDLSIPFFRHAYLFCGRIGIRIPHSNELVPPETIEKDIASNYYSLKKHMAQLLKARVTEIAFGQVVARNKAFLVSDGAREWVHSGGILCGSVQKEIVYIPE